MTPGPELDRLVAEKVLGWREMDYELHRTIRGPEPTWVKNVQGECVCEFRPSRDLSTCAAAAEEARKAGKLRFWLVTSSLAHDGFASPCFGTVNVSAAAASINVQGESCAHALALALLKACE